ncbi:MAG: RdgB/HAM1 family non-canonical purine NTP pyrophosphatase [Candidatus Hydrogenedentota bacterium]
MARVLLIGSGNKDKQKELRDLLSDSAWDVKGLKDFDAIDEPEETEDTFEGNALLKARYYGQRFGVACVADDSGIEVDALNGKPGVYSARYAGEDCTYDDNNQKMLKALEEIDAPGRGARFVSCAAFVDKYGTEHVEVGTVDGVIASECKGKNGFGYDPLFIPVGYERTFGELGSEVKAEISHRGRAFRAMSVYLDSY